MPKTSEKRFTVSREVYEKYWPQFRRRDGELPSNFAERIDEIYPKSTIEARSELLARGYDVDRNKIDYLLNNKRIKAPKRLGREYLWNRANIDELADLLEADESFNIEAQGRRYFYVDAEQQVEAFSHAVKSPIYAPVLDASQYGFEAVFGAGTVRYQPIGGK